MTIIGGGDVGLQLAERLEPTPAVDVRILEVLTVLLVLRPEAWRSGQWPAAGRER